MILQQGEEREDLDELEDMNEVTNQCIDTTDIATLQPVIKNQADIKTELPENHPGDEPQSSTQQTPIRNQSLALQTAVVNQKFQESGTKPTLAGQVVNTNLLRPPPGWLAKKVDWSQNFCVVNLEIKHWSLSYAD